MDSSSSVPLSQRANIILPTTKPPFLTALTIILELSFLQQLPAHVVVDTMHNRHPSFRIFTTVFVTYLIGTPGPGVPLPNTTREQMIEYARGIFTVIVDLRDNGCSVPAILDRLREDGYNPLPRGMVQTIVSWYRNYQIF